MMNHEFLLRKQPHPSLMVRRNVTHTHAQICVIDALHPLVAAAKDVDRGR